MPALDHPPQPPSLQKLFLSFLRLGLTAFGGPAMVAYIRRMAVDQEHWIDEESFKNGVSFCQMMPGATAMQTAAYTGMKIRGWAGALASFIGFGLPAFCIMTILSSVYVSTATLPASHAIFHGLQVITVAIIASAVISFGRSSLKQWRHGIIALIAAVLFFVEVHPVLVILFAGLLGLVFVRGETPAPLSKKVAGPGISHGFIGLAAAAVGVFILLGLTSPALFDLATTMARIDLFAFGGGFASLPLMFHEVVDLHTWLDAGTFLSGIALGQVTPGPIVVTATFVGYLTYGLPGAIAATFGIFVPSFLIVVGLAPYFDRLRESPRFHQFFNGILFSFVGLLASVTLRFAMGIAWDLPTVLLAAGTFTALVLGAGILWVVLVGIAISFFLF